MRDVPNFAAPQRGRDERIIERLIERIGPVPRVLACGSRAGTNRGLVYLTLNAIHTLSPIHLIINGKARGYDALADQWAATHDIAVLHFIADWRRYGRGAGPRRNELMLTEGKPDLVVAFPGNKGTTNLIDIATRAGVPVHLAGWSLKQGE